MFSILSKSQVPADSVPVEDPSPCLQVATCCYRWDSYALKHLDQMTNLSSSPIQVGNTDCNYK